MKKRFLGGLAAATIGFGVAACGSDEEKSASTDRQADGGLPTVSRCVDSWNAQPLETKVQLSYQGIDTNVSVADQSTGVMAVYGGQPIMNQNNDGTVGSFISDGDCVLRLDGSGVLYSGDPADGIWSLVPPSPSLHQAVDTSPDAVAVSLLDGELTPSTESGL